MAAGQIPDFITSGCWTTPSGCWTYPRVKEKGGCWSGCWLYPRFSDSACKKWLLGRVAAETHIPKLNCSRRFTASFVSCPLFSLKCVCCFRIAENFGSLKQQFTVFKLHHQNFFQRQNFLILEETERSSYLFLFCALQPSRYLPQEIKVIILASISNSECSDTGLFWLRMWVFLKWSMVITDALSIMYLWDMTDLRPRIRIN